MNDNNNSEIISLTKNYVQSELHNEKSGHDWWHTYRVWKIAKRIGEDEGADLILVELAALLHDIADWKLYGGDFRESDMKITNWLSSQKAPTTIINAVKNIINNISFKGAGVLPEENLSLEAMVVQDADRLDAIGAIGIARVFTYGGKFSRLIHDPDKPPIYHKSTEEYLKSESTSINHFYEKLLLVKDLMNTRTGRYIAEGRHNFLKYYLEEFFLEWEGLS